jgi:hypothetical protein
MPTNICCVCSHLFQADKLSLGNSVGRLEVELTTAQTAAADAQQQLSAARQLLLSRASQLGSAEGLQGQLEEAAAQLGAYKAKLEAAEQEVSQGRFCGVAACDTWCTQAQLPLGCAEWAASRSCC